MTSEPLMSRSKIAGTQMEAELGKQNNRLRSRAGNSVKNRPVRHLDLQKKPRTRRIDISKKEREVPTTSLMASHTTQTKQRELTRRPPGIKAWASRKSSRIETRLSRKLPSVTRPNQVDFKRRSKICQRQKVTESPENFQVSKWS
jgi:hypothetical protein